MAEPSVCVCVCVSVEWVIWCLFRLCAVVESLLFQ
jgi:hypothetical protein